MIVRISPHGLPVHIPPTHLLSWRTHTGLWPRTVFEEGLRALAIPAERFSEVTERFVDARKPQIASRHQHMLPKRLEVSFEREGPFAPSQGDSASDHDPSIRALAARCDLLEATFQSRLQHVERQVDKRFDQLESTLQQLLSRLPPQPPSAQHKPSSRMMRADV